VLEFGERYSTLHLNSDNDQPVTFHSLTVVQLIVVGQSILYNKLQSVCKARQRTDISNIQS